MVWKSIMSRVPERAYTFLVVAGLIAFIFILVNPLASLDLAVLGVFLLSVGHVFLREKLLLVFLLLRPTIDAWRDTNLFTYQNVSVNLNATLAILFFAWSALMLLAYRREFTRLPMFGSGAALGLLIIASIPRSVSSTVSFIETIKFINILGFFWLSYLCVKTNKFSRRELVSVILLSVIIPVIAALWQLVSGTGIDTADVRGRLHGTLAHPNVFAFLLLAVIIIYTHAGMIEPTKFYYTKKSIRYTLYAALVALLLLTYTRAAYIGLGIFVTILGLFRYRQLLARVVIGVSLFFLLFYPLNQLFIHRFNVSLQEAPLLSRLTSRNEDADSLAWRQSVLRETIPLVTARPMLGFGYGVFPLVWEENRSAAHFWEDGVEAHNDYLRLALELGLVGLAVYFMFLTRLLQHAWQAVYTDRKINVEYLPFFAWVAVFIAVSLSDNMLNHTAVMWLTAAWWGAMLAPQAWRHKSPNLLHTHS